ncbi:MAG: hypothetical protein M1479_06300 [Actinobacteria bacterium]|nr:hypothetical protein [Actinomycetota bacterium]
MHLEEDMKNIVENIISSYEARVESIGIIFDTTHKLLQGFQDSFIDTKHEREKLTAELRENLAKNKSLRRNDFDNMMQDILSTQDKREKEVRILLNSYLNEHKKMVQALSGNLEKFKSSITEGEIQRVKEFQNVIKKILGRQEERKEEVTSRLKEFQKEQKEMAKRLKELLSKGKELRIKDLKSMLKELKAQGKERIACKEERREEVNKMLSDFKKERLESARHWKGAQREMTKRRTKPPAVNIIKMGV